MAGAYETGVYRYIFKECGYLFANCLSGLQNTS